MAEGGVFPWKIQKIVQRKMADYGQLRRPLPSPPADMIWVRDGRDWKLIPKSSNQHPAKQQQQKHRQQQQQNHAMDDHDENHGTTIVDALPLQKEGDERGRRLPQDEEDKHKIEKKARAAVVSQPSLSSSTTTKVSLSSEENEDGDDDDEWELIVSDPDDRNKKLAQDNFDDDDDDDEAEEEEEYLEHVVLPSDTLQGICLAYKISNTRLKKVNRFSGHTLQLAPKKLLIPVSGSDLRCNNNGIRKQDRGSNEYKVHAVLAECPDLSFIEAKAYLEMSNWTLKDALRSAREDSEWEREIVGTTTCTAAVQHRGSLQDALPRSGTGKQIAPWGSACTPTGRSVRGNNNKNDGPLHRPRCPLTATTSATAYYEQAVPLMTKTVKPEDIYNAAHQHGNVGLELQPLVMMGNNKNSL